jgi:hypothetical protein
MNKTIWQRLGNLWRAEFLSRKDLLRRAFVIGVAFLAAQLAGLREFTSVLNGTTGSMAVSWEVSALLGLLYVVIYLAFVILVPVLILAASILTIWQSIRRKREYSVS